MPEIVYTGNDLEAPVDRPNCTLSYEGKAQPEHLGNTSRIPLTHVEDVTSQTVSSTGAMPTHLGVWLEQLPFRRRDERLPCRRIQIQRRTFGFLYIRPRPGPDRTGG